MRYFMEYIPCGKHKSYKRRGRTSFDDNDDEGPYPGNSVGKVYRLSNVQYEQVR